MPSIVILLVSVFAGFFGYLNIHEIAPQNFGASTFIVQQGGTGQNTFTSSQLLYGAGTGALQSVATTSATCSGSASCSPFTVIGSSPITISASGGSGGSGNVSTSTGETSGFLAYWTSTNGTPALLGQVATGTLSTGTGLSVTANRYVIGGNATVAADTGYNIPLTASTTNWNSFYDTPSSRITDGTGLTWSGNTLNCDTASGSVFGCLASADWTTFNNKQAAGNYITALTGDVTASGPGSVAATLATVNSDVGSFTNSSITVNAKGLITAASSGSAPEVPLTFTWPLIRTTNTISFGGLSTSTDAVVGNIPYFTGVNTFGNVATTSATCTGSASCSAFTVIGDSPVTITGSGITSITGKPGQFGFFETENNIAGSFYAYASSTNFATLFGVQAGGNSATTSSFTTKETTAFGYRSLRVVAGTVGSGLQNSAFGSNSLSQITTGNYNTAVGNYSLPNSFGASSNNVAVGYQSSASNLSATNTVAVGYRAAFGSSFVGLQGYTAVGYQSGLNFAAGADYNTLFGFSSGLPITTGSKNILIGAGNITTGENITTGSNNIKIGYDNSFPSATASNQLNIGNLLYGAGVDGVGQTYSTGQLGVGSTTPSARFGIHLNNGDTNSIAFAIGSSTAAATTTLFSINNTGIITTSYGTGCVLSTSGVLSVTGSGCNSGTVTSVDGSGGTTGLTLTGGPITSSGTLTLGGTLAIANGGTNATSFTQSGGITAYDGTRLVNFAGFTLTSLLATLTNASTTALTVGTFFQLPNSTSQSPTLAGVLAYDTTSGQLKVGTGTGTAVLSNGNFYPAFTYATSTAWTGTTTIPLGTAYVGETWNGVQCFTDVGTLNVSFYDGTNRMNMLNASTTVGTVTLSTNNTFTAAEKRYVDVGTPATNPTKISCTVSKSITAD